VARSWVVSVIENGVVRGIHTASCRTSILPVGTGIGNIIRHIIYANVYLAIASLVFGIANLDCKERWF
jgi:hypothetical protein